MSVYKSSPKYIFYLFIVLSMLLLLSAPAVAAPPADGNFWYQTITIESNETVTDGLYHVWIPFPYDWSNGNYNSYRLYYENGTAVPFHIFSATGTELSLSFKGNVTQGNNTFYLSAGNESFESVQTTSIYGAYKDLTFVTANSTFSVPEYNFGQMMGGFKNSAYNSSTQFNFYKNATNNVGLEIETGNTARENISLISNNQKLISRDYAKYGQDLLYYHAADSINGTSVDLYGTLYSSRSDQVLGSIDFNQSVAQDFVGNSVRVNVTNASSFNSSIGYATGNYSSYTAYRVSDPIKLKEDFLIVSWVDLRTGDLYGVNGNSPNTSNLLIRSWGTNATLVPARSNPFAKDFSTNVGTFTINNWSTASASTNTSQMNARTATFLIPEVPQNIPLTSTRFVSTSIPANFNVTHLRIPYLENFTYPNGQNNNTIYTLVVDSDGNPVSSATVEYYLYGSQLEASRLTLNTGIAMHNASNLVNYAIFAEARNYGNNTTQVVTRSGSDWSASTGALLVLESKDNITVTVRDYDTLEVVSNYTAYLGENQRLKSTDNGTVEYDNVTNGVYDIVLVSDGYNQVTRKINVTSTQRDFSLYMTKTEDGNGSEQVTTPQYITYYVRNQNNTPLQNVLVSVYEINGTDLLMSKMTGVDGSATFTFNRTLNYRIEFTYAGQNESVTLSGSQSSYYVVYLNVSSPGPSVSLFDRLTASMRVSSINNTSVIISAMVVDRLASLEFGENTTYSISPNMTQESVQFGTGFVIVNYIVDRSVYDEWAQNAQVLTFRATVENESETVDLIATLFPKKSGSDLLDITIPDEIKLGIIIGAMILMTIGSTAFNTASITYVAALLPILFGSWLTWITVPLPILLLFVAGLVLVIMYDMRKQDK